MKVKTNVELEKSGSFFLVDPKKVVANLENNSRKVVDARVKAMAESFHRSGQETPVLLRAMEDGSLQVVFGFTRHAAAILHNEKWPDQKMKLKAEVREMSDVEAFEASVVENNDRDDPDPVEIAQAQKKLMEHFGKSPAEVAALYGWKGREAEQVGKLQKLLTLPAKTRQLVSKRELPLIAAIELTDLSEAEQDEVLASAERKVNGKIKGESVRKAAKEKKRKKGRKVGRSIQEVKAFFQSLTGPGEDKHVRKLAATLEAFIEGTIEPERAEHTFLSLGGLIEPPKTPRAKPEPEAKEAGPKPAKVKADKARAAKKAAIGTTKKPKAEKKTTDPESGKEKPQKRVKNKGKAKVAPEPEVIEGDPGEVEDDIVDDSAADAAASQIEPEEIIEV